MNKDYIGNIIPYLDNTDWKSHMYNYKNLFKIQSKSDLWTNRILLPQEQLGIIDLFGNNLPVTNNIKFDTNLINENYALNKINWIYHKYDEKYNTPYSAYIEKYTKINLNNYLNENLNNKLNFLNTKKKIIMVITTARTGSTTLIKNIENNNKDIINLHELFDTTIGHFGNFYQNNKNLDIEEMISKLVNSTNKNNILIKIFFEHLEYISLNKLIRLLDIKINKKIIILKRNTFDSFISLKKSVKNNVLLQRQRR